MDLALRDKVAIVTGGSRGIGRSIALGLADEGCHVAICARNEERLRETEAELRARGVDALGVVADITKADDIDRLVAETVARFGRLHILVNNAGGGSRENTDEAWDAAYRMNILAAVRATRAAAPHMQASGGGSIVHIASIWGRESGGAATYNAMKSAMVSHAKAFLAVQKEFGSFDAYAWQFVGGKPKKNSFKSMSRVPATTAESDTFSKDLKQRGFRFVGSTICYAFMQAVGMVNDHTTTCFRYPEVTRAR